MSWRRSVVLIIAILAADISNVVSRAVNISNTWFLPQEGFPVFYRYFRDRITWFEADAVCQFHHANLVTVDTSKQYDTTRAYLKELDVVNNVWIGLKKKGPNDEFSWTDYKILAKDGGYWQEQIPKTESALCAAIDPAADYRWHSFNCGGPEVASFICELPVPPWARKTDGCMLTSLPSLSVTYLPEKAAVELSSDCGLDGTRRITCKGQADRAEMIKQLSCEQREDEEVSSTTTGTTGSSSGTESQQPPTRHRRDADDAAPTVLQSTPNMAVDVKTSDIRKSTPLTITTSAESIIEPLVFTSIDRQQFYQTSTTATLSPSSISNKGPTATMIPTYVTASLDFQIKTSNLAPIIADEPITVIPEEIPEDAADIVLAVRKQLQEQQNKQKNLISEKPTEAKVHTSEFDKHFEQENSRENYSTSLFTSASIALSPTTTFTSSALFIPKSEQEDKSLSSTINVPLSSLPNNKIIVFSVNESSYVYINKSVSIQNDFINDTDKSISQNIAEDVTFEQENHTSISYDINNNSLPSSSKPTIPPSVKENNKSLELKSSKEDSFQFSKELHEEEDQQRDLEEETRRRQFLPAPLRGEPKGGEEDNNSTSTKAAPTEWVVQAEEDELSQAGEEDALMEADPPQAPARPNRGRRLTRPQGHSFYPYFLNRVLG